VTARFVDGFFLAGEAARELDRAAETLELRACLRTAIGERAPELGNAPVFGPEPPGFSRLRLTRASTTADLDGKPVEITAVSVSGRGLTWGAGGAQFQRGAAEGIVSLAQGSERFDVVVTQALADDEPAACHEVEPLIEALERFVGLSEKDVTAASDAKAPSSHPSARFSVGFEGDAVVVRDHESRGPRDRVRRYVAFGVVSLVLTVAATFAFIEQLRSQAPLTSMIGFGAAIPVSLLAAVAMFEIARYAGKYSAESAPLAWFADDRVVVAPWVSRLGAVDRSPEGRFGAAISPREITSVEVRSSGEAFAVTLDGPHGPIEVLLTSEREVARRYQLIIERVVRAVAAPKRRAAPTA